LAQAAGKSGPVLEELQQFAVFLQENGRIKAYLMSPEVEKKPKQEMVEGLLHGKVSPLFRQFILLLLQKGRQNYFSQIVDAYGQLYDQSEGRMRAQVISAVPLQERQMEQIRQKVGRYLKAEVLLENKVDADVLGGVIIKFSGVVIDGSLRHQLNQLRRELRQAKSGAAL
jgi:F-type H+-transporting ATPase subunit delta